MSQRSDDLQERSSIDRKNNPNKLSFQIQGFCENWEREREATARTNREKGFFLRLKAKCFFCQFGDDRTIATGNDWGCEPICWCLIVNNLHQPCCHSPRSKYCHFHYSSLRFSLFLFSAGLFSNHFYIWKQPHFFWIILNRHIWQGKLELSGAVAWEPT